MILMAWNDAQVLGIDEIDEQHRMLVDMINELQEKTLSGQGKQAVADALQGLTAYTVYHFREEEALMAKASYAFTDRHKGEHAKFVQAVEQFTAEAILSLEKRERICSIS